MQIGVDVGYLRWDQPDDERRPAAHQHRAVPVVHDTARRGDGNQTNLIGQRLLPVTLAIEDLYFDQSCGQRGQREQDQRYERDDAPHRRLPTDAPLLRTLPIHERSASYRRIASIATIIVATFIAVANSA